MTEEEKTYQQHGRGHGKHLLQAAYDGYKIQAMQYAIFDKDPKLIIDEISSLLEADYDELEKRLIASNPNMIAPYGEPNETSDIPEMTEEDFSRMKLKTPKDFVDPMIQRALLSMALSQPLVNDFHPTGRPKFKTPEPKKRAKTKAARKQRNKQK